MLKAKRFARKTKRGGVVTVHREHYLRDDIWCGVVACPVCKCANPVLSPKMLLVPDTNVVSSTRDFHQLPVDFFECQAIAR
jgi:exosome complex exonuclease DIS3/RRP44